jgi:hypothetical protein
MDCTASCAPAADQTKLDAPGSVLRDPCMPRRLYADCWNLYPLLSNVTDQAELAKRLIRVYTAVNKCTSHGGPKMTWCTSSTYSVACSRCALPTLLSLHCRSFSDDIVVGYIDVKGSVRLNPADTCTPGPGSRLVLLTNGSESPAPLCNLSSAYASTLGAQQHSCWYVQTLERHR